MVRVGLLGFGGIGHVHYRGYAALEKAGKAKLVAICDVDETAFEKDVEINLSTGDSQDGCSYNQYTSLDDMLQNEQLDMIDICLPTYLHKEMTVKLLNLKYHVLCEKPMAKTYAECTEMLAAAKANGKRLMIGQCLHFAPEYEFIKETVESGVYGKPLSAMFQRLSTPPVWGWENWFMDSDKSGGCIQDLHIHDIDMARYLFGEPNVISCRTKDGFGKWDMAHSALTFGNLPVTVIGDWSLSGFPFTYTYRVAFEHAVVICESGTVTVHTDKGEILKPEIGSHDPYASEAEYFINLIENGGEDLKNPADSSAISVKLIETLRESAMQGGMQITFA